MNGNKRQLYKLIVDLQKRVENLHKKKEESEVSIKNHTLQQETFDRLKRDIIEQIRNDHRVDPEKLEQFNTRLDGINILINQLQQNLHSLKQRPLLEQGFSETQNLTSQYRELQSYIQQIEQNIDLHNNNLNGLNTKLNNFSSTN